jgi:hypothetical protein
MEQLLREASGSKQSHPSRVAMWAAPNKAKGVGLSKPFRAHIHQHVPLMLDMGHEGPGMEYYF